MRPFSTLCAASAAFFILGSGAAAQSFRETVNRVLLGSPNDRMGLVEIQNASDCVVRLANPKTAHFSVLRLNNVDPGSLTVQGKRRDRFISFSGPGVIVEVHSPDSGLFAASRTVQITVGDWEADRRAFEHLYAEFCSGRSPSGSDAAS